MATIDTRSASVTIENLSLSFGACGWVTSG